MASYLVTGGGRGLGLELVTQLSRLPESQVSVVFAATRSEPSGSLKELIDKSKGRVVHTMMVITDPASIKQAVTNVESALGSKGLDVLINNAGTLPLSSNGIASMDNLMDTIKINVEAVHQVTAAFLPVLKKGSLKKVVNISSTLGSIDQAPKFKFAPPHAYKISKAALNMLTTQYALEYEKEGFTFLIITPGWLKTDLGTDHADLTVDVGAKAALDIIFRSTQKDNGVFQNIHVPGWEVTDGPNFYDGKPMKW